jgi:hypothetical protein
MRFFDNGQWYRLNVTLDAEGNVAGVEVTAVGSGVTVNDDTSDRCSITLQQIVNQAQTHVELAPLANVAGYNDEPALSLCNDVIQELLSTGYTWKFNRVECPPFFTQRGKQDYFFAGASAFTTSGKSAGIALTDMGGATKVGTTVTIKTIEKHAFEVGETVYLSGIEVEAYNSTFTQTPNGSSWTGGKTVASVPTPYTFTYTDDATVLAASGAPGISNFGELESATMVRADDEAAVQKVWHPTAVRSLKPSSDRGIPDKVAVVSDESGVLKIRLHGIPESEPWQINLVYQRKAPQKTALTQTWFPFPDEYAFVFRQAFLARAYRYINSRRADIEEQKAQRAVLKAMGKDDGESSDEHFAPQTPLMDWGF